jgi:hypothetical protein
MTKRSIALFHETWEKLELFHNLEAWGRSTIKENRRGRGDTLLDVSIALASSSCAHGSVVTSQKNMILAIISPKTNTWLKTNS